MKDKIRFNPKKNEMGSILWLPLLRKPAVYAILVHPNATENAIFGSNYDKMDAQRAQRERSLNVVCKLKLLT